MCTKTVFVKVVALMMQLKSSVKSLKLYQALPSFNELHQALLEC